MVRPDPLDSVGSIGGAVGEETRGDAGEERTGNGGWTLVADHDGAAALLDTILQLDADAEYTKSELSDASTVAYKTLYLDGTVESLVEAGLLESTERDGEETTFRIDTDSAIYEAALAFDESVARSRRSDSS